MELSRFRVWLVTGASDDVGWGRNSDGHSAMVKMTILQSRDQTLHQSVLSVVMSWMLFSSFKSTCVM